MTLLEAMRDAGVDVAETLRRFSGNEALLERFMRAFPQDETFSALSAAVDGARYDEAGRLAHTLKGIAGNLGFQRLQERCADLVSAARETRPADVTAIFDDVAAEHRLLLALLEQAE